MRTVLALLSGLACGTSVLLLLPARPAPDVRPARVPVDPGGATGSRSRLLRAAMALLVGSATWFLVGSTPGLVTGCLGAAFTWWWVGRREPASARRRRERLVATLPHVVDLMASCLTAGVSPTAALDKVAAAVGEPMGTELDALSARLRLGIDPVTVWSDAAAHPQLGALSRAVARAVESGASVADAMVRLSEDLRVRSDAQVEARARSVGVRAAVPLGVCLLPAFVLVGVVPLVAGSLSVLVRP